MCTQIAMNGPRFLPERDYVTFGYLLLQIRLSSVTFVGGGGVKTFGNISSPYLSHPLTFVQNFDRPRGTPPSVMIMMMMKLPILTCAEKPEAYRTKNHELKPISTPKPQNAKGSKMERCWSWTH